MSVSPQSGSTAGGTELTLEGSLLVDPRGPASVSVLVAGIACTVSFANASIVRCKTGSHGPTNASFPGGGLVRLSVSSLGEAATNRAASFQYQDMWGSSSTWGGAQPE